MEIQLFENRTYKARDPTQQLDSDPSILLMDAAVSFRSSASTTNTLGRRGDSLTFSTSVTFSPQAVRKNVRQNRQPPECFIKFN